MVMGHYKKTADIYTIPPDQPFLKALVHRIIEETKGDPLKLSDYTIVLPTRDACDAFKEIFNELSDQEFAILPNLVTPSDMDSHTTSLRFAEQPALAQKIEKIPKSVSSLKRQIYLAKSIMKQPDVAPSFAKAFKLSGELGRFLDDIDRQEKSVSDIAGLVSDKHKKQWQKTVKFLDNVLEDWDVYLKDNNLANPEIRRRSVIEAYTSYLKQSKTKKPVLIAGFNAVDPALSRLFQAVGDLPGGKIILPALHKTIDEESWDALEETHPQYSLKKILDLFGVERQQVEDWPRYTPKEGTSFSRVRNTVVTGAARRRLLTESLRPAVTAEQWSMLDPVITTPKQAANRNRKGTTARTKKARSNYIDGKALTGMDLVTCGTSQEEASVIALKMREVLEVKGRTATLVTSDRTLARRVSARLRYWQIEVPDSAGQELNNTRVGTLFSLTAAMAHENLAPIPLLECLKHPLVSLGDDAKEFRQKIYSLEDYMLRGPRPSGGFKGLKQGLKSVFNEKARRRPRSKKLLQKEYTELNKWLIGFEKEAKSFVNLMRLKRPQPFEKVLKAHIEFVEKMAEPAADAETKNIWNTADGRSMSSFLKRVLKTAKDVPDMTGAEYTAFLNTLMSGTKAKNTYNAHPYLKILSPAQARLTKPDIMIIGGLNEGVWPPKPAENMWMSTEMMRDMGLETTDQQMGQSAYDFVQFASNPETLMIRADRDNNAPTVPSPYLTRLLMVLKGCDLEDKLKTKAQWVAMNEALHTPGQIKAIAPPAPTPPVKNRPKELPVTGIETLLRDPYSLYARYILKLYPRPTLDAGPSYAERGTLIHDVLEQFVLKYPDSLPKDAYEQLIELGKEAFENRQDNPSVRAFWWPRFERIAQWFVTQEVSRREMAKTLGVEVRGRLELETKNLKFVLTAIADRIDLLDDDTLSIVDYKTGGVPTQKSVALGTSPQLTLEALIAQAGGFKGIDAGDVGSLEYWKLSGGRPAGKITYVTADIQDLEEAALQGLIDLIEAFSDPKTPYLPTPRPLFSPRFNNYKHLSRSDEWGRDISKPGTKGGRTRPKKNAGRGGPKGK